MQHEATSRFEEVFMNSPDPRTILGWPAEAVALPEKKVAELLHVQRHVLRDLRLRDGSVQYTRLGRRVLYTVEQVRSILLSKSITRCQELKLQFEPKESNIQCNRGNQAGKLEDPIPGLANLNPPNQSTSELDALAIAVDEFSLEAKRSGQCQ